MTLIKNIPIIRIGSGQRALLPSALHRCRLIGEPGSQCDLPTSGCRLIDGTTIDGVEVIRPTGSKNGLLFSGEGLRLRNLTVRNEEQSAESENDYINVYIQQGAKDVHIEYCDVGFAGTPIRVSRGVEHIHGRWNRIHDAGEHGWYGSQGNDLLFDGNEVYNTVGLGLRVQIDESGTGPTHCYGVRFVNNYLHNIGNNALNAAAVTALLATYKFYGLVIANNSVNGATGVGVRIRSYDTASSVITPNALYDVFAGSGIDGDATPGYWTESTPT